MSNAAEAQVFDSWRMCQSLRRLRVEAREPSFETKNGDVVSEWRYWAGSRCGEAFVTRVGEN